MVFRKLCVPTGHPHGLLLLVLVISLCFSTVSSFGGDKPTLNMTPTILGRNRTDQGYHRQDVCERYEMYRRGQIELRDALSGLALRPVMIFENNTFFRYTPEEGIADHLPGIMVELLDTVAQRANFTWRGSFGVVESANSYNMTWTELLYWTIENYDISIAHWAHTVERMENGVTYPEPWFDSSLVLIDRTRAREDSQGIDILNWTKPFEPAVWGMIVFTIFMSGLVYQLIEYLHDAREDRTMFQWFSDNLYLSAINFSQNFEYAPNSTAGRIFGVSMTLWALVITATYTANLASLFVEARVDASLVDSMEEAVVYGYEVCTYADTNADLFIKETFPKARREPRDSELSVFASLRKGECALAVSFLDTWLTVQEAEEYNPDCNLQWVGETIWTTKSGFAVKADSGYKCTSVIRHVIHLHLVELVQEGALADLWNKYREDEDDGICVYEEDDESLFARRALAEKSPPRPGSSSASNVHRELKAGGRGSEEADEIDAATLTLEQMAGTFILHWGAMAFAIALSFMSVYAKKENFFHRKGHRFVKVTNREHGPKIGSPPPVNTWVLKKTDESSSANVDGSENGEKQECDPLTHDGSGSDLQSQLAVAIEQRRALDAERSALDTARSSLDEQRKALDAKMESILQDMNLVPQLKQYDV